jgi:hypothetical protein
MEPIKKLQLAKYFKFSIVNKKWIPCNEFDEGSNKLTLMNFENNDICVEKINLNDFNNILKTFRSSINNNEILELEEYLKN